MKRRFVSVAAVALAGMLMFSSCIGSFGLFNKVLAWNQTIDNKFVNEVVFFAMWIVPVYEISFLADILVINSIEFWSGENPVQAGIVKKVQGENGVYTVETLENGYNIQNEAGQQVDLVYDKDSNTWSAVANGESTKLIKFEDEKNAIVYLPNGQEKSVELSNDGVLALRQSVESTMFYAAK
ncbi:hypothetical protein M2451_003694 [Dysgonomonas sp. PFB1-18]|uniref:DUF3332 domain-containing protein n=1 Tax=unclassified Dysgonomonas TaxID=2630389 RepID=UPI002474A984|nr:MULTISPECIES: DUF3332 domain-containing protein [unclassified Dysgonomonas]MDH6310883.1 hypothetical protein [Dysgonomonas sp. PF1-14]MDH6340679.1 hypothetical protein [Dysgonomonas sp. PF1-16]MDH6382353.1 hypothetical protein [Dysgonomonas sp. PFB1-18]MDH6399703.1 hypothetical protein [Dysgonomonas sp. PF1-23]